jgi:tetratricopeptide (TPR) repeat protein
MKQALLINGMSAPALTYYAEWWLDRGDTVSAERYLNQALEADPKFVPTYQAYTRFYMKVNDLRRAKQTMLHAIELDPENSRSYYQMAELLALAGHPEEAVKYAVKSEELDFGNNLERDHFLAQQHEKLGDAPKALEYYNRVMTFSPDHVPTLMRVADLMDSLGQPQQSMSFYKKAMSLEPALLAQLIDQARTALRKEKTEEALRLWRRVLSLKPGDDEALHALASAHYVNYFYKQSKPDVLQSDIALFEREADNALSPLLKVDRLKLEIAVQNGLNETVRQQLNVLAAEQDALASGEALFLLGQYLKAQDRLDAADGETGQDYLNIADRLLLDQELVSSAALYQRGYQLERLPALKEGMDRIKAKRDLAEKRIQEGNVLVSEKKPAEAVTKYQEASQIYREWDIPYMRLGDTYERLNKDREAFEAYREAVQLTPSLLDSKGFSKKYEKLNKKFSKVTQTKPAE